MDVGALSSIILGFGRPAGKFTVLSLKTDCYALCSRKAAAGKKDSKKTLTKKAPPINSNNQRSLYKITISG
jgi:hypothetical protein